MRKVVKVFDGVVETTESDLIPILTAKKVTLYVERTEPAEATGTTTFTAKVGVGDNMVAYNRFISNVTNTNTQSVTRVANIAFDAAGTGFLTMDPADAAEFIQVKATIETDGTASAWLVIEYDE